VYINQNKKILKQQQEIRHAMIAFFARKSAGQISLCLKNQTTAYEQNPRRIEGAIKLTCTTKRTPLSLITWLLNKLGGRKAGSGAAKQWRAQLGTPGPVSALSLILLAHCTQYASMIC